MTTVAKNACLGCGGTGHWLKDCPKKKGGASAAPSEPRKPGTCVSCGETGHWYKDCPKKKKGPSAPPASTNNANDLATEPGVSTVKKRPKKKVSADDLVGPNGILYVYQTFPKLLKGQLRGEGHEAHDLDKLEALYYNWHKRLKPNMGYAEFVEDLEKLGGTKRVRANLREIRLIETGQAHIDDLIQPGVVDDGDEGDQGDLEGGFDGGPADDNAHAHARGHGDGGVDDWDTLVGNDAANQNGSKSTGDGAFKGHAHKGGLSADLPVRAADNNGGDDGRARCATAGSSDRGNVAAGSGQEEEEEDVTDELLAAAAQLARQRQQQAAKVKQAEGNRSSAAGGEDEGDWFEEDDLAAPDDVMNEMFVDM